MPTRVDYDKAILFAETRLKVSNADLRGGQVETVKLGGSLFPWGNQGGFAVVYKFRSKSGKVRALRCFTKPINPDIRVRYERMGPYFRSQAADITADFTYHDQGIEVEEVINGQPRNMIYPVIDMEWIDGATLFDHVEKLAKQRDQAKLGAVANRWFEVVQKLRQANMAHGDLAAVNIMVRIDGRLVLVDYDGVYLQAFQGKKQLLTGTPGFQHPRMAERPFNEWMDEFSALVIFTALLALQTQPALWDTYVKYGPGGKALDQTLLFTHEDFEAPQQSALFRDLERSPSAQVRDAAKALKLACGQWVGDVRFPTTIAVPDYLEKQALTAVQQAIDNDSDDEQIVQAWVPLLERYQPAQQHRPTVERSRLRMRALDTFRRALQSRSLQHILAGYDAVLLDPCKNVAALEREQLALAQQLDAALRADKDDQMLAAWQAIQQPRYAGFLILPAQDQQRIDAAQRRKTLLDTFRAALATHSIENIVAAFDPALDSYPSISMEERQVLIRALGFFQACQNNDDEAIEDIAAEIQGIHIYSRALVFSPAEEARIHLAIQRKEAIKRFKKALATKRADEIAASFDHAALDTCRSITPEERQKVALAEEWEAACKRDHDERIVAAWEAIERSPHQGFLIFTQAEVARVELAKQCKAALDHFRQILNSKNIQQICLSYRPALHDAGMTQDEHAIVARARQFSQACQADDDLAIAEAASAITNFHTFSSALLLTRAEQQRAHLATQRAGALMKFRMALKNALAEQIEASYDPYLLGPCKNVTQAEREQFEAAKRFNQMRQVVLAALLANNLKEADALYDEALAAQFVDFTPDERKRLEVVRSWGQLERALDSGAHLLALRTAQAIEKSTGRLISDVRLRMAKRRFILSIHPQNIRVSRMGSHVQVQWDWPASDLIPAVAIAWRFDHFPRDPTDVPPATQYHNPYHCYRNNQATQQGAYTINVGYATTVYIQIFSAIPDWDQVRREQLWYYSDGQEETARSVSGLSAYPS